MVAQHARARVAAHREHGLLTTLKHFPGHGSATGDTHLGITDITDTYEDDELLPYATLIDANFADGIMTSHLIDRRRVGPLPMTLTPDYLHHALRETLGFDGLLVSDGLCMGSLVQYFSFDAIAVGAVAAGHDILVSAQNAAARGGPVQFEAIDQLPKRVVGAISRGLATGKLQQSRLYASYERLRAAKMNLGSSRR